MNTRRSLMVSIFLLLALLMTPVASFAAFVSGSTGADGAFAPTTNTVLQIPESGVFNYTTVNIPAGVTVTFTKNAQNTPVTILATGDVTIAGSINLNGGSGSFLLPGAGGPGGVSGGNGGVVGKSGFRGEGPGGGGGGSPNLNYYYGGGPGGGGGFGADGGAGTSSHSYVATVGPKGTAYGNERILPLIGGSGGGGGGGTTSRVGGGGGGGGGSLLIASSGTITVSGSITATGGNGAAGEGSDGGGGGAGSGGSIRLIANTLAGNGSITANGGSGGSGWNSTGGGGGAGRIRLEFTTTSRTSGTSPPFSFGAPSDVVPANMPTLVISSVGGMNVPSAPKGSYGTPDVTLPWSISNPIAVVVNATNIPAGSTVTAYAIPSLGTANSATGTLSGTDSSSTATISLNISTAYPSIVTATVTFQLTASNGGPTYAGGERVDKIRIAASVGGGSSITYITESGREIPALL